MVHALSTAPFWLSTAGIFTAWYLYSARTEIPGKIKIRCGSLYTLLDRKYYMMNFIHGYFWWHTTLGTVLWKYGDVKVIDGFFV